MRFLHTLQIKVRDSGRTLNDFAYLAIGADIDLVEHISKIQLVKEKSPRTGRICSDLITQGIWVMFIVCYGLPEAVDATWPDSMASTCVVHQIRVANG